MNSVIASVSSPHHALKSPSEKSVSTQSNLSPCQRERSHGWLAFKLGKGGPPNYMPDHFKQHGIRDSSEELPRMFIDHTFRWTVQQIIRPTNQRLTDRAVDPTLGHGRTDHYDKRSWGH